MPEGDDTMPAQDAGSDGGGFVRSRIEDVPNATGEAAGVADASKPMDSPGSGADYYDEPAVPPITAAKTGVGMVLKAALGVLAVAWLVKTVSERD